MRYLIRLAVVASVLSGAQGQAQEPANVTEPVTSCAGLLPYIPEITNPDQARAEAVPGGCRVSNAVVEVAPGLIYSFDAITLITPDILKTFPTGAVFEEADLHFSGMRMMSPVAPFASDEDAQPLDIRIAYRSDHEARTSTLDEFSVDAGSVGRIAISAHMEDFDNSAVDAEGMPLDGLDGKLKHFSIELIDNGFFDSHIGPYMAGLLPLFVSPELAFSADREDFVAAIKVVPAVTLDRPGKSVLARFVRELPNPQGRWNLTVQSESGFEIADLVPQLDDVDALLASLKISATYEPLSSAD